MYVALSDRGVQAVDWQNTRQPLPTFGRYQIAGGGRTPLFEGFGQAKGVPFYMTDNPVAAFIKALQSEMGVPTTSVWDPATHEAFWRAVVAYAVASGHPESASMPMLPWQVQVCASDAIGQNPLFAGEFLRDRACVPTAEIIFNMIDDSVREMFPGLAARLSIVSWESLRDDPTWENAKGPFATEFVAHVGAQLAVPVTPPVVTCPTGMVLQADGSCAAPGALATTEEPWYKKTSTWLLIGGGVLLVGLLIWGASKKSEAPALPAAAEG